MQNVEGEHALSLYVYSPPLETMIYDDRAGDLLIPRERGWAATREQPSVRSPSIMRLVAPSS